MTSRRRITTLSAVVALVLGTGLTLTATPAPARTEAALTGAISVGVGDDHSCALLASGQVRCWGDNGEGQLGDDSLGVDSAVPVPVSNISDTGNLTGVTQLDVGNNHNCARLSTGQAVCWGRGGSGRLGDNGGLDQDTPVSVRNADDTANLTGVTQVTAGDQHSCARLGTGQARCWGDNFGGRIGDGDAPNDAFTAQAVRNTADTANLTGVAEIHAGDFSTCARLAINQVRCWGLALSGRLGNNTTTPDVDTPVVVRGTNGTGALTGVTQLSTGGDHSCARLASGQAVCWGDSSSGALGDGTDASDSLYPGPVANTTGDGHLTAVTAVDAGANATCARLANGRARCWGNGADGRLGNGDVVNVLFPVAVRNLVDTGPLRNVTRVAQSAGQHGCAVLANQQVRCWGDNDNGQLGNNDLGIDTDLPVAVHLG